MQWCPMSKSVLLSYINSADVMRVKRESKNTYKSILKHNIKQLHVKKLKKIALTSMHLCF